MKIKTNELTGVALDRAVAKCEGHFRTDGGAYLAHQGRVFQPSTDWAVGGPIIERENITLVRCDDDYKTDAKGFTTNERIPVWAAEHGTQHSSQTTYGPQGDNWGDAYAIDEADCIYGPTPLIAAMRCYVASKLGDEVNIPEELC